MTAGEARFKISVITRSSKMDAKARQYAYYLRYIQTENGKKVRCEISKRYYYLHREEILARKREMRRARTAMA